MLETNITSNNEINDFYHWGRYSEIVMYFIVRYFDPLDTGRKLNVHKTFRRRPRRLLNVLCTLNLHLVPTGERSHIFKMLNFSKIAQALVNITKILYLKMNIEFVYRSVFRTLSSIYDGSFSPHKKWNFHLRISSVNLTKTTGNWGFGHVYWRNPQ